MKRESFVFRTLPAVIFAVVLTVPGLSSQAAEADKVFATVGDFEITRDEFEREVYSAARQTFYHGQPPGGQEFVEFRRGVADKIIDRQLLLKEAQRLDLEPDHASIDAQIAVYEDRYGDTERWQTEGAQMVAALRSKFEEDSILESLEAEVRSTPAADDVTARAFYDDNPDLFTEPAQNRVSVILLGVPAAATPAVWQAAREEAQIVLQKLGKEASFEELASLHSSDKSAQAGGDMGYLHRGMLSADSEAAIAELEQGQVSDPVQVLEGIAIFKLTDRKPEQLREFADVEQRARELWARDVGERQWNALVAELRSAGNVTIDSEYLLVLPEYVQ
jgi:parvulin-like peptidyl-prolyl isomerase